MVVSPRSAFGWLAMAGKVVFQHKNHLPVIDFYRSRKLIIRTVLPVQTQIDGDPSGTATCVKVSVETRAVLVRVATPQTPA